MRRVLNILGVIVVFFLTSCSGPKKSIYFKDDSPVDPIVQTQKIDPFKEAIIQPDDILAVNVTSPSSIVEDKGNTTIAIFNSGGTAFSSNSTLGGGATNSNGFLVDPSGYIDYPFIGKIKLGGLSIREAKEALSKKLQNYVKEPVVEVRIVNYHVTILGEVGHAGTITAPNHKISIIDALAAAGDIPITGRKDNVTVIRETEGTREFAHLNLNSKEVFKSPYFYLKQNDIVYVEPARLRRQEGNDFFKFYLPTITTLISSLFAIYGIVQLTNKK